MLAPKNLPDFLASKLLFISNIKFNNSIYSTFIRKGGSKMFTTLFMIFILLASLSLICVLVANSNFSMEEEDKIGEKNRSMNHRMANFLDCGTDCPTVIDPVAY